MDDLDLDRIRQTWRELSDVELARALKRPEDYPPEVQAIIEEEACRRKLDPAALDLSDAVERTPMTRLLEGAWAGIRTFAQVVHRLLSARPSVGGAFVGVVVSIGVSIVPVSWFGALWPVPLILLVALLLAGLTSACWPLRQHRVVLKVTFAGACGFIVAALPRVLARSGSPTLIVASMLLVFATVWIVPGLLLWATVHVRNRYWPVFPEGFCATCGYNLWGLPSPRCPECGTPFGPDRRAGAQAAGGRPAHADDESKGVGRRD